MSKERDIAIIDLVIANRALARLGILGAYGHVSARNPLNPDTFLISRSRSPEIVSREDIMEVDMDGRVLNNDNRPAYLERFIHSEILKRRPDINSVVHGHANVLIPFTVTPLKMKPVIMHADEIGNDVPVWDIRTKFGDTDLLIVNQEQGADLATALGDNYNAVLLRGHGFVTAARSAIHSVRVCKALVDNAAAQLASEPYGPINVMTGGEIAARQRTLGEDETPGRLREFEYEAIKADLADLYAERVRLRAS